MKITTMNLEVDIMTLVLKLITMKTEQMKNYIYQSAQIRFKKTSKSVVRAKCSFKKRLHTSR